MKRCQVEVLQKNVYTGRLMDKHMKQNQIFPPETPFERVHRFKPAARSALNFHFFTVLHRLSVCVSVCVWRLSADSQAHVLY